MPSIISNEDMLPSHVSSVVTDGASPFDLTIKVAGLPSSSPSFSSSATGFVEESSSCSTDVFPNTRDGTEDSSLTGVLASDDGKAEGIVGDDALSGGQETPLLDESSFFDEGLTAVAEI